MRREGYRPEELIYIQNSYEFSATLFSGFYRANGKTFLAHLVGTASILAALKLPVAVVAAGLLHAAYLQGDFGWRKPGVAYTRNQGVREQVRAIAGEAAERYIFRYTRLSLDYRTDKNKVIPTGDQIEALTDLERQALMILIANELEEYLDLGMLYCRKLSDIQLPPTSPAAALAQLSRDLGFPVLGDRLLAEIEKSSIAPIEVELKRRKRASYQVHTASYRKKYSAQLLDKLFGMARKIKATVS
jgi:hypothetical protein